MEPDDLAERVAALEKQVRALYARLRSSEEDAAAARVLAGGADRDVSEFGSDLRELNSEFGDFKIEFGDFKSEFGDFRRATTASFNALREDFTDLRGEVNDLRADMNSRFERVDNGFIEMRGRLDAAAAGQQQIVELIQGMIGGGD